MIKSATLSACGRYRYDLRRTWAPDAPWVLFIGLNPATADAQQDDPTTRVCLNYARRWRYGGLILANLFAYRATRPDALYRAVDPVGPQNDAVLRRLTQAAALVVCAWGERGGFQGRDAFVLSFVHKPHCLTRLKSGRPGHPLYKRRTLLPAPL